MDSNDEAWKVFWCEHLSPVMLGEVPEGRREAYFRTLRGCPERFLEDIGVYAAEP